MDRARLGKIARIAAFACGGILLLLVLAIGGLLLWLRTPGAAGTLFSFAADSLEPKGIYLKSSSITGHLPFDLSIKNLSIADDAGLWLEVPELSLALRPFKLLSGELWVENIYIASPKLLRLPALSGSDSTEPDSGDADASLSLPIDIRLERLKLENATTGASLLASMFPDKQKLVAEPGLFHASLDAAALLKGKGLVSKASLQAGAKLRLTQPDGGKVNLDLLVAPKSGGELVNWLANADFDGKLSEMQSFATSELDSGQPDAKELVLLKCSVEEPENGMFATILGIDDFPAVAINLDSASNLEQIVINFGLDSFKLVESPKNENLPPIESASGVSAETAQGQTGDLENNTQAVTSPHNTASLVNVRGSLHLTAKNGVAGMLDLAPDWQVKVDAQVTPGPLLNASANTGAIYAVLPPEILNILSPYVSIELSASTASNNILLEYADVDAELWRVRAEELHLAVSEEPDVAARLLVEIKEQAFYEKLGLASATDTGVQALWGATSLSADVKAGLRGHGLDFTTDILLAAESEHPYFTLTGVDANVHLQGVFKDSLITLDKLHLRGMDLEFSGQGSLNLYDFTTTLESDFILVKDGKWYQVISSLANTTAIPCADFSGKIVAGIDLPPGAEAGTVAMSDMYLRADVEMLGDYFTWPAEILHTALGDFGKFRVDFGGPMTSPYHANIYNVEVGRTSFTADDAILSRTVQADGWYDLALPGKNLPKPLEKNTVDGQSLSMQAEVKAVVTDFTGFLPESLETGGSVNATASMFSVLGGDDNYFIFKAGANTPSGQILYNPVEDITEFSAKADALMRIGDGVDMQGNIKAVAWAPKSGQIDLNSEWFILVPQNDAISTGARNLHLDSSAGKLGGHMKVIVPVEDTPEATPALDGELTATVDDWDRVNELFARLKVPVSIVYGDFAQLSMVFTPVLKGTSFRQDAKIVMAVPELSFSLDNLSADNQPDGLQPENSDTDIGLKPLTQADADDTGAAKVQQGVREPDAKKSSGEAKTEDSTVKNVENIQEPDFYPGPEWVRGLYARLEVTDLFADPELYASIATDTGKVDLVSWNSFALYLDIKDKAGRINLAMRDDNKAIEYVSGIESIAVSSIGRELARSARSEIDLEGLGKDLPVPESDIDPEELFVVQAVFNLDPMELVIWRMLAHSPSRNAGIFSRNPAKIYYGKELRVEDVNMGMLTGGYAKLNALFTDEEGHLNLDLSGVPIATAKLFSKVQLPEGLVDADFNLLRANGKVSGQGKLSAMLQPMRSELDELYDSRPVLLTMHSVFDEKPGDDFAAVRKLGVQEDLAHLRGSAKLSATEGEMADLNIVFDVPFTFSGMGVPVPAYHTAMGAKAVWKGNISNIWRLLPVPDRDLRGLAQFDVNVGGTLADMEYAAEAYMAGGRYEDKIAGLLFTDIALEFRTSPDGSLLRLSSKDGLEGNAAFEARLSDRGVFHTGLGANRRTAGFTENRRGEFVTSMPTLTARGQINHLAPLRRDDVSLRLSGLIDATGPLNSPDVKGDFVIERCEVNLLSTLGGSISTLEIEEKTAPSKKVKSERGPELDIKVDIPNRLFIRGLGLDSEWQGNATIKGPASSPYYSGRISPVRGYMNLLSRPFALGQGNISFWGGDGFDSSISLQLTYSSPSLVAYINAGGSATKPTLTLSSMPPMPHDQILSQVLFGKNITQLSPVEALQVANSVRELITFGSGGLGFMTNMRRFLGVDTLRIGSTGGNAQTRRVSSSPGADAFGAGKGTSMDEDETAPTVEAGKYLNDAIYIGVEQGAVEDSTRVRVEVELSPNLTLQGSSSTKSSDVGIGWKKDY